ncbi:beta-ureidopropionase [bacterium]|nr:beta-ureidopropionase [bacterium]
MRVAFVQFKPILGDVRVNLEKVEELISAADSDVFVLPELFSSGYLFPDRDSVRKVAEPAGEGPVYETMFRWARTKNALVAGGFPEIGEDGKLYNSAISVKPDGEFVLYRKVHLFDREKLLFEPGNLGFDTFVFGGVRFGMLICFDWIFPESYRVLMLKGAQVILHMTNLVLPYCQRASFARAVENRMFIIVANRIGTETLDEISLTFTGKSVIYSPEGEILAEAGSDEETVPVVEIDPAEALDKNITSRNNLIDDRRPEFYKLIVQERD